MRSCFAKHWDRKVLALDNMKVTPATYAKALYEVIETLPRNQAEGAIARFVVFLKEKGKLHWGRSIIVFYERYARERENQKCASVMLAHEVSVRAHEQLKKDLQEHLGVEEVGVAHDPALLGGAVVRHGYTIIDASVRGMLSRLTAH